MNFNCTIIIIFLILIYFPISVNSQDRMITKTGNEELVKIIEISNNEIRYKKYENLEGPFYISQKQDIFMIVYANGSKDVFNNEAITESHESKSSKNTDIILKTFFYDPQRMDGNELKYLTSVLEVLEKHGYKISSEEKSSELKLNFQITGSASVTVLIILFKQNQEFCKVSTNNPGFGTWIARGSAIKGLVNFACSKLDKRLAEIVR